MDRYNKYLTKHALHARTHFHTAHTTDDGQYLAGWPPRETIRAYK